jgi:hypothetical protein
MGGTAWAVVASVDDPLEINDGWAIARGDVVFLDLRASISAPGTVGRYSIASIINKSSREVGVTLEWAAAGAPVSPSECIGVRGYLAQPVDVVGTVSHPTQQTMLLQQEVIDLAKQVELYAIGDEAAETEQSRSFPTDEVIAPGTLVHVRTTGMAVRADPQDPERMPASGVALAQSGNLVRVQTSGIVPRLASGLIPGAPVFVGDAGLPITDPAGITLPASVQMIGVALDASSLSLAITGQLVKRA